MKRITSALALITLGASSAAFAADFSTLDVDGSGTISKAEASIDKALTAQFDTLDADGNGELSKEEFAKAQ